LIIFGLPLDFANTIGLLALLSVIPLIILYLLRPKPVVIKISSVMFLFGGEKKEKRFKTIRRFIKDPLFLIQLLVLLLLGIAAAEPFTLISEEAAGGQTAIVLDASASMQADQRFEEAISEAQKFLTSKNTLILAENIPVVALRNTPKQTATETLTHLTPRAGEADLSRAILLATRYLSEGGRIIVISDFSHYIGDNPEIAAGIARGSGFDVQFVQVTGGAENVGIVDGWFEGTSYNLLIHNYNEESKTITLTIKAEGKELLREERTLPPESSEPFTIENLPEGKTTIILTPQDDLNLDNTAYIITPRSLEKKLLHISQGKSPSLTALQLLEPTVKTEQKPDYTGDLSQYGITIITKPTELSQFNNYVKSGGVLVVLASKDLENSDLLPLTLKGVANQTSLNILSTNPLTENLDPNIEIKRHIKATPRPGAVVLAEAGDGSPMLAYWNIGGGKVLYIGFAEPEGDPYDPFTAWNSFHATPTYPLFWKNLIEWSTGSIDVNKFNLRAGALKQYPQVVKVTTPTTTLTTDTVLFDETGFYTTPQGEVAVNLYSREESNITPTTTPLLQESRIKYLPGISEVPRPLDTYLVLAGILFILLELYYLRWRGEL
jgi:hypothetical protein